MKINQYYNKVTKIDDLIRDHHENYKEYLKLKRRKAIQLKSKEDFDFVQREYSYKRKIFKLLKEHNCIQVFWDGDESDVYTTWVYANYDEDDTNDPYQHQHYCDSYEEAYDRCLEYIKLERDKGENN